MSATASSPATPPASPSYRDELPPTGWPLVPILITAFVVAMYAGAYWLTLPVGPRH